MLPEISVVAPVYGCADCLDELYRRVAAALDGLVSDWELVLVDDRSPDGAWANLQRLAAQDDRVRALRLSRNFGQHAAITAGLSEARGNWVVVMDCDLQDPPEEIPRLYAQAQQGYEIVFARRLERKQSLRRRVGSHMYFWLRRRLAGVDLETEHANLSMLSRKAADAFLRIRDRHRNYLLILYWLGFEHTSIDFEQADRFAGRSAYSLPALIRLAVDSLFFHTTVLLRWIVYVGFAVCLASVGLAVFFLYSYFTSAAYPGWTSMVVLLLLIGGVIIMTVGVSALYIGKVFEQVKERPLFVVDERTSSASTANGVEVRDRAAH